MFDGVWCLSPAVIAGYDGTDSRAFVVSVSSKTPGNYTLSGVTDHASLGATYAVPLTCCPLLTAPSVSRVPPACLTYR